MRAGVQSGGDPRLINADLAPTQPHQRTWTRWNIAALWVGMSVCIPTYMLAASLGGGKMTIGAVVAAVGLGNIIVLIPMVLNAHAGTRYGIPFPVLLRAPFGVVGANIPAMLRAIVACGWFGIQTWIGGSAIHALVSVLLPDISLPQLVPQAVGITTGQLLAFTIFWLLQMAVIWRGMESIRWLETWSAPLLIAIGLAVFIWALARTPGGFADMVTDAPGAQSGIDVVFGAGLTAGVSYWGTLALNIPDFSRYARSQRDQIIGQAIGLPPTMATFAFVGAAVTNASFFIFGERIADPIALLARIGGPVVTVFAMLALLIATLTTNLAANIVSPANDFSALAPARISFRKGAFIAATLGFVIMPWKLLGSAYIFTWLLGYGALLGAVCGIMLVDYYIIRRRQLDINDLYRRGGRYEYRRGFNWIALTALAVGIAPNIPGFLDALDILDAGVFFNAIYEYTWFISLFVASIAHAAGMWLFRPAAYAPLPH